MTRLADKRDPMRLLLKRLMLVALLILVPVMFLGVMDVYRKERGSRALREQAETERSELHVREARLEESIADLHTDRGMEEALRKGYSLAEEGEGLIVIVESQSSESVQATTTWERWMHKLLPFW